MSSKFYEKSEAESEESGSDALRQKVAFGAATLSLLAFLIFLTYLLSQVDTLSTEAWTRATYLLTGVEAIVFAGLGFIFGREVQRGRAAAAERRNETVERKLDSKTDQAAAGKMFARYVVSMGDAAFVGTEGGKSAKADSNLHAMAREVLRAGRSSTEEES